jgi:creatinine amidohydrolase
VVVAPLVNYSYYPAFVEYPGSTTLRLETARDMLVDICRSLSNYGPKRFYALNTGVSTLRALEPAAKILLADGILLRYTNVLAVGEEAEKRVKKEEGGTHADEIETSLMLFIAPATVDMTKAVKDYHPGQGGLTRDSHKPGAYSSSGVFGDATLATRAKGEAVANAMVEGMLREIEDLRRAPADVAHASAGVPVGPSELQSAVPHSNLTLAPYFRQRLHDDIFDRFERQP